MQGITVFPQSKLITKDRLDAVMATVNNLSMPQFERDWGLRAELTYDNAPGNWSMWIMDKSDHPGDLAYHVDESGIPIIKVFVSDILAFNSPLDADIDHETKEALRDPTAARIVQLAGYNTVDECCDPVSSDHIDFGEGRRGANYILPSWMGQGQHPYDAMGLCTAPQQILPGGYVERQINGQWQLAAVRLEETGLLSWRVAHHGRLCYHARNR